MTAWVLLRGLGREARHWGRFASVLQQCLPPGDRVIALDLPGNGRWSQRGSPLRVEDMVDAARSEWQSLRIAGPCMLVALSLGGMVAAQWASRAPHEVRGCVLVNSSMAALSPFWQRLRPACWPRLVQCMVSRSAWGRETAVYRMTSNLPLDRGLVEDWVRFARTQPVTASNVLRQLLAAARFRAPGRLPVPGLVLASARDRLVSARCSAAIARAWALPMEVHPSAGHDLPLDDPEWVAACIAEWYATRVGARETPEPAAGA